MFANALGCSVAAFLLWGLADTLATVLVFAIIFGALVGLVHTIHMSPSTYIIYTTLTGRRILFGRICGCKGFSRSECRTSTHGSECLYRGKRSSCSDWSSYIWFVIGSGSKDKSWPLWEVWFRASGDFRGKLCIGMFLLFTRCCCH